MIPCLYVKEAIIIKITNFVHIKDAGDPVDIAKFYDKAE